MSGQKHLNGWFQDSKGTRGIDLDSLMWLIRLLRPRQWVKNVFVLAPLIFSGEFLHAESIEASLLAFLVFCIASSATYIVNDLHDIEGDRRHPTKSKTRPLAAGKVTVTMALGLLGVLLVLLVAAGFVAPRVVAVIAAYLLLNLAYSFVLKHQPVIDIFTIALGFVLRVYAGAMAWRCRFRAGCSLRPCV